MGCDIHMFIEYKLGDAPWKADEHHQILKEDGYEHLRQVSATGRNYHLFGKLAGVRTNGPEPKGLPDDCTEIIRSNTEIKEYGDDHSHSYSSLEEFRQALKDCDYDLTKQVRAVAFSDRYENLNYMNLLAYLDYMVKKYSLDLEAEQMILGQPINTQVQCRLVYWFDN
jgi:hypothetical protein